MLPLPLQVLAAMLAGWIHRRQQEAIAYLEAGGEPSPSGAAGTGAHAVHGCTEFPVGKSRSRYRPQAAPTDHNIVTPDTLLRWLFGYKNHRHYSVSSACYQSK
jgi:hypothetical protein